jgi:hypothetical protein
MAKARMLEAREEASDAVKQSGGDRERKPGYSVQQQISWHLEQAQDAWNRHDKETAYAHWHEVLRLDRGNASAMAAIRDSMVDGARGAIKQFALAKGVTAIAEALDDQTDDMIAQRMMIVFRNAIQNVDGSLNHSPDYALYDDFENYIDTNGLGRVVSTAEVGEVAAYYNGRIYGRKYLESLASWIQRVEDSGIYVQIIPPFNVENAAEHLNTFQYTIMPTGEVTIDGPNVGPDVPLEAIWQDGAYRIAPRHGYRLLYQFHTTIKPRRYRRI